MDGRIFWYRNRHFYFLVFFSIFWRICKYKGYIMRINSPQLHVPTWAELYGPFGFLIYTSTVLTSGHHSCMNDVPCVNRVNLSPLYRSTQHCCSTQWSMHQTNGMPSCLKTLDSQSHKSVHSSLWSDQGPGSRTDERRDGLARPVVLLHQRGRS